MHFYRDSTMASNIHGMTGASATGASTAAQDGPPKELGHGAYGTVFLRSHPTLGLVAVKVFRIPAHCDAEALAMGILEVPHRSDRIIKYHGPNNRWSWPRTHANSDPSAQSDPSRPPKIPALVYEFCPFGDVEAFIREWHPVLNQTILSHWTRHVAEGLQFLASLDVVHADLKPKNLLVRHDKTLVIADLGRSLVSSRTPTTTTIRGTPFYASQEILRMTGITPVADVFSLGLIIYEWATGELPHTRRWNNWCLSTPELVEELKWRIGTNDWKPALPAPYTGEFAQLVQGMLNPIVSARLTASQVLATRIIGDTRALAFEVPIGLTGEQAVLSLQCISERTAHMGQIAQLARDKLTLEQQLKINTAKMEETDKLLLKVRTDAKLSKEELAVAKKTVALAGANEAQAKEELRVSRPLSSTFNRTSRRQSRR